MKLSEGPVLGPSVACVLVLFAADLDGLQGTAAGWVLRLHLGWISQKLENVVFNEWPRCSG